MEIIVKYIFCKVRSYEKNEHNSSWILDHHIKENRKFKICRTNAYNFEKFTEKLKIVDEAYPIFLKSISNQLNKAHSLNWKKNDWEIIIGT